MKIVNVFALRLALKQAHSKRVNLQIYQFYLFPALFGQQNPSSINCISRKPSLYTIVYENVEIHTDHLNRKFMASFLEFE